MHREMSRMMVTNSFNHAYLSLVGFKVIFTFFFVLFYVAWFFFIIAHVTVLYK